MGEKFQKRLSKHKCCIKEKFVTQTVLKSETFRSEAGSKLHNGIQSDKAAQAKQYEKGVFRREEVVTPPPPWPSAFLPCEPRARVAVRGEISLSSILRDPRGENFILGT